MRKKILSVAVVVVVVIVALIIVITVTYKGRPMATYDQRYKGVNKLSERELNELPVLILQSEEEEDTYNEKN